MIDQPAPELEISEWLNSDTPLSLATLKGKVIMIEAFQMLCPGCVAHALPLAERVHQTFSPDDVAVLGLHSVFEHHEAQGHRAALEAFVHEYKLSFPIGIDKPATDRGLPQTMHAYGMRGTPTLLLIDRAGQLRKHHFGQVSELVLGAEIMRLVQQTHFQSPNEGETRAGCTTDGCTI